MWGWCFKIFSYTPELLNNISPKQSLGNVHSKTDQKEKNKIKLWKDQLNQRLYWKEMSSYDCKYIQYL